MGVSWNYKKPKSYRFVADVEEDITFLTEPIVFKIQPIKIAHKKDKTSKKTLMLTAVIPMTRPGCKYLGPLVLGARIIPLDQRATL